MLDLPVGSVLSEPTTILNKFGPPNKFVADGV